MSDVEARIELLRRERSRFLAFAFARGDLLIEIDPEARIVYALGAGNSLAGLDNDALIGLPVSELFSTGSKPVLDKLRIASRKKALFRPEPAFLKMEGKLTPVSVAGCPLPNISDSYFLSLAKLPPAEEADAHRIPRDPPVKVKRDKATGLVDAESFAAIAEATLQASREGDMPLAMTVVDVDGLTDLERRLDDDAAAGLMRDIGAVLGEFGTDRNAAARMAPNRFGVLHGADVDAGRISSQIAELAKSVDPSGRGVAVAAQSLKLDAPGMSEADAGRALVYAINKFAESNSETLTIDSLNSALQSLMDDTVARVAAFRETLASKSCVLVFQPILELDNRVMHHQEALSRLPDGSSPFQMVTFAEEAGFVSEFDLAVCRKALKVLADRPNAYDIAINVSGRSLESALFVDALLAILREHDTLRKRLLIEITESSRITHFEAVQKVVGELRKANQRVCIDDFGAGAAAFHYLRALNVDVVKIDGSFVRDVHRNERDRAFVRAIVSLCAELGIETVAEFVETKDQLQILLELGVRMGQGYLFAKAQPDPYERAEVPLPTMQPKPERSKIVRPARWV